MEILIVLAVVAWLAYACYRSGKRTGSVRGFNVGRHGRRWRRRKSRARRYACLSSRTRTVPHKIPGWAACGRPSSVFFFRYQRLRRRR